MTQRSILAGQTPTVIVRAGGDVNVVGWDGDRVQADTDSRWGLNIERGRTSDIGRIRARAKVGERVLFDVNVGVPGRAKKDADDEAIEVHIGGSGTVHIPSGRAVKVYAGKGVDVRDLQGRVTVYAGSDARLRNLRTLMHVSAGGSIDLECEEIEGYKVKFAAGRDLRCFVKNLTNAMVLVSDLGGHWEATLGDGRTSVRLEAGGDVTLVTDQVIMGDILGNIERPPVAHSEPPKT